MLEKKAKEIIVFGSASDVKHLKFTNYVVADDSYESSIWGEKLG